MLPVWYHSAEEVRGALGEASYPVYEVGKFRYHLLVSRRLQGVLQAVAVFLFYLRTGMRLHRQRRFDCIVASGHTMTAFAGTILKLLTRTRLIVELIGTPRRAYCFENRTVTVRSRLKKLYSDALLHVNLLAADRARLLYPAQLDGYPLLWNVPTSVFHEFVNLSLVRPAERSQDYLLFVGYPWYLKGVDVLIKAFRAVASEFPQIKLKLLGFFPDRTELDRLADGHPRIEFLKPLPNPETLRIMEGALILILPSRTEAMGRVLLEAMAAKKAVIASNVDGIPYYVQDGFNGLLCRPGDPDDLAAKLRRLLSNTALMEELAVNGLALARSKYDEQAYVREFEKMVRRTAGGGSIGSLTAG